MTHFKGWSLALTAALTLTLTACGGGGSSAGKDPFASTGAGSNTGGSSGSGNVTTTTQGSLALAVTPDTGQISASAPGRVSATVKDASGKAVKGVVVYFTVDDGSLATVSPASVQVDANGLAETTVQPSSGGVGATYVNAKVTVSAIDLTARKAVSITPTNVTLDAVTADSANLSPKGSTAIRFSLTGVSPQVPASVKVSSTCATQGRATLPTDPIPLTSGTGSATYTDNGCAGTDRVVVSLVGTAQSQDVLLNVAIPSTQSIEFVSSSNPTICLAGSGCAVTSNVSFKVKDTNGAPKPGVRVNFGIDQRESARLAQDNGTSDATGLVSVSVSAYHLPGPVRVTADIRDGTGAVVFQTVSSILAVNAGLPYQPGIDLSSSRNALNANLSGDKATVTTRLTDRFGNPVPDGTAVSFVTEGGVASPASCTTLGGNCNVSLQVTEPRPADGRVTLVSYAQGEEFYTDTNANGQFDPGEFNAAADDLGEVYVDRNENGVMDDGEKVIGNPKNGTWDNNNYVRKSGLFFFSVTASSPRLFEYDKAVGMCTNTPYVTKDVSLAAICRDSVVLCVKDANTQADSAVNGDGSTGNPIASGSTLGITTTASGARATVDNSPVADVVRAPQRHVITVQRSSCDTRLTAGGDVDLSITTGGKVYTYNQVLTVTP